MIKFKHLPVAAMMLLGSYANAQLKTPAPSPLQTLDQAFALSNIKIEYSRPSAKGRVVFGDLVPFGKIWRTGANASTKITFGDTVKVEGMKLAPGTYALYSIPNKDSWEVMFYNDLKLGGDVAAYKAENEALKIKVPTIANPMKMETFTIGIADMTSNTANIMIMWENTRVVLKVSADIDAAIMKNIEKNVINDSRPYFAAASYYYENDKDLKLAKEWVAKAFAANPKAYWIAHLEAKICLKMKDYAGAIAAAEKSKALAVAEKDDTYVANNDKLIAEAKKGGK